MAQQTIQENLPALCRLLLGPLVHRFVLELHQLAADEAVRGIRARKSAGLLLTKIDRYVIRRPKTTSGLYQRMATGHVHQRPLHHLFAVLTLARAEQ